MKVVMNSISFVIVLIVMLCSKKRPLVAVQDPPTPRAIMPVLTPATWFPPVEVSMMRAMSCLHVPELLARI
jgi:hypothetical protein